MRGQQALWLMQASHIVAKVHNKTAGSTNTQMTHMRDVQNTFFFNPLDSPVPFKMGQGHHHVYGLIKLLRVYQDAKCSITKSEF